MILPYELIRHFENHTSDHAHTAYISNLNYTQETNTFYLLSFVSLTITAIYPENRIGIPG